MRRVYQDADSVPWAGALLDNSRRLRPNVLNKLSDEKDRHSFALSCPLTRQPSSEEQKIESLSAV